MNPLRWQGQLLALMMILSLAPSAQAQRAPRIGYVFPAGGRPGTTVQLKLGGQYLDGVTNVLISGAGVRASVLEYTKPLNGRQVNLLRDRLRNLQQGMTAAKRGELIIEVRSEINTNVVMKMERTAAEKEIAEIRKKLANPNNIRPANPQLAEEVILQVTLASDAEPGKRELRLKTAQGLTAPLAFCVGQLPEFTERERNTDPQRRGAFPARGSSAPSEMSITIPAIVNGQIMPGDVDRYRFLARRGQHLVVVTSARDLIPYLADAVPGWFQATLALYDAKGKELAYDDDFRFHPDPVLHFEIPKDGEYVIEIKDAIYRGREDFVYRITLGELPFVTSIFPLGGPAGTQTTVELKGWNLSVTNLTQDTRNKTPGFHLLSLPKEARIFNQMPFAVDSLPEGIEKEPNNTPGNAQPLTLPIIVNGRIDQPGDADVFSFKGRAGDEIVAEVYARRLDSPLDSILKLTDASGQQLAINDDYEDKGTGLNTHHADSRLAITLPVTGAYYLRLGDAQQNGGGEYAYRLRVSAPQPDFELRMVPSSLAVRAGATIPITIHAVRKDGFTNEITLSLKDAPAGFTLSGGRIPSHTNQARLTLSAPSLPPKEPVNISIAGRAKIQGREIIRPAVPAEDMMQAFAYRHLVPSDDLVVAVTGRGGAAFGKGPGKKAAPKANK
jgi:hypothetical protein